MGKTQDPSQDRGECAQAAEHEAAKQRLIDLAESERLPLDDTTRALPDRRWQRGR